MKASYHDVGFIQKAHIEHTLEDSCSVVLYKSPSRCASSTPVSDLCMFGLVWSTLSGEQGLGWLFLMTTGRYFPSFCASKHGAVIGGNTMCLSLLSKGMWLPPKKVPALDRHRAPSYYLLPLTFRKVFIFYKNVTDWSFGNNDTRFYRVSWDFLFSAKINVCQTAISDTKLKTFIWSAILDGKKGEIYSCLKNGVSLLLNLNLPNLSKLRAIKLQCRWYQTQCALLSITGFVFVFPSLSSIKSPRHLDTGISFLIPLSLASSTSFRLLFFSVVMITAGLARTADH